MNKPTAGYDGGTDTPESLPVKSWVLIRLHSPLMGEVVGHLLCNGEARAVIVFKDVREFDWVAKRVMGDQVDED